MRGAWSWLREDNSGIGRLEDPAMTAPYENVEDILPFIKNHHHNPSAEIFWREGKGGKRREEEGGEGKGGRTECRLKEKESEGDEVGEVRERRSRKKSEMRWEVGGLVGWGEEVERSWRERKKRWEGGG